MNLNDWAKEIHELAVSKGWWDEKRGKSEILALIHSEWSEALEAYRDGDPIVYQKCLPTPKSPECPILVTKITDINGLTPGIKPEGIAVELVDGCIRILDYIGYRGRRISHEKDTFETLMQNTQPEFFVAFCVPDTVEALHRLTSKYNENINCLLYAMGCAFRWIKNEGLDPEEIMRIKHEYNKTRPHRHGGKVC